MGRVFWVTLISEVLGLRRLISAKAKQSRPPGGKEAGPMKKIHRTGVEPVPLATVNSGRQA